MGCGSGRVSRVYAFILVQTCSYRVYERLWGKGGMGLAETFSSVAIPASPASTCRVCMTYVRAHLCNLVTRRTTPIRASLTRSALHGCPSSPQRVAAGEGEGAGVWHYVVHLSPAVYRYPFLSSSSLLCGRARSTHLTVQPRLIFAESFLKTLLAFLILNYDFTSADGRADPPNVHIQRPSYRTTSRRDVMIKTWRTSEPDSRRA